MLAVFASVVGFGVIKAVKGKLHNSMKQQKYSIDDLHLQQGCTEGLELASQLLGSAILNIDSNMDFVPNSKVPASLASSIQLGKNDKRNWSIDNQGVLYVTKCMSLTKINEATVFSTANTAIPKGACTDDQMISAAIKPTKVLDPIDEDYAHLVWKTAIVSSRCTLGSGKTLQAKARINFLPPSQICDYESDDNKDFCNVDHCKYMAPLLVSEDTNTENKGDVYLDDSSGELDYSLIPNPKFKQTLRLPAANKIPQVEAFLHPDDDQVVADPPEDLVNFITKAICPGLNNPFETWQGVKGSYSTHEFLQPDGDAYVFTIPAYSRKGMMDISDNPETVKNAQEAALEFKGYLYYENGTSYMQGNGSAQLDWQVSLQRANPGRHKQLLQQGCQRTVGISDADFCTRVDLTHAYFDYSYPKKRKCEYEGPAGISSSEYASFINDIDPDLAIGTMKPWLGKADLRVAGNWQATSEDAPGFYNLSKTTKGAPKIYEDPKEFYHHEFDVQTSISDPGTKVAHDFSGIVTSVLKVVEVKEVDVAKKVCSIPDTDGGSGDGSGGDGSDSGDDGSSNDNSKKTFTRSINASGTESVAHSFGTNFNELNVSFYTGTDPDLILIDHEAAGFTIAADDGDPTNQLNITAPATGGPFELTIEVSTGSSSADGGDGTAGDDGPPPDDCDENDMFVIENNPGADLTGYQVVKQLRQRNLTLTWRADCDIEESIPGENIAIANAHPACAVVGSSLKLQPAADHKFDKCYYIAYYDSESRHNCTMGLPTGKHYECRNNNGCFAKGTPILMADGKYKAIERLIQGELVLNPVTLAPAKVVSVIVGPQQKPMFKIYYDNEGKEETLTATYNHPFVGRQGFVRAEELKKGDHILLESMQYAPIKRIVSIPVDSGNLVYNLTLEEDELSKFISGTFKANQSLKNHMFTANGVVTGDYYIQSKPNLSEENKFLMLSNEQTEIKTDKNPQDSY